jgi:hypothetical protein
MHIGTSSLSHPRPRAVFSGAARAVGAIAFVLAGVVAVPEASAGAPDQTTAYRPLVPCRLLDTRDASQVKPGAGGWLLLAVRGHCGVAADATAVAVTVTITEAAGAGFINAWPAGQTMPLASTNNYAIGETRANGALLSLGGDGNLSLFTSNSAHVVVDVSGEFYPSTSATSGRYVPLPPARALDTREADAAPLPTGGTVTVPLPVGVPADATALAVMLTITTAPSAAFVTAYPAGSDRPFTSSLNTDHPRQIRTATQIVPVSAAGLTVFSNVGGHIIVDVVGYFTGPSAPPVSTGLFVPATPTRVLDTRATARVYPGGTVLAATVAVTGANAIAVAANVTVTESGPSGYVTAWAGQTDQPGTPAVSYDNRGQTVANLSVVSVTAAGIAVASTSGTHVVVDITGWFTGVPLPPTTGVPANNAPVRVDPTGPIGCLQSVPAPTADNIYQIQIGANQLVAHIFTAGPKGPIVVVGDSLTFGSAAQTARALRANGWGPICIDGTISRTVEFGSSSIPDGLDAAYRIRASNPIWDDPTITWVVALGTNDVGYSTGNAARADKYIADQIAAIGPNPISWMNVCTARSDWQYQEAIFNQAIKDSGVAVIDWYSASEDQPWIAGDKVHLTTTGYQARADLLALVGWQN